MARREPPADPDGDLDQPSDIDRRVCHYLDRLNEGVTIDPVEVLAENPMDGQEILERLERFVVATGFEAVAHEPLGTIGHPGLQPQRGV